VQLQLALDGTLAQALAILQATATWIDIIEVGTPLVYREGVRALEVIRQHYPDHVLLADFKIMDAGTEEAAIAFAAGAHIVTVMALAQDVTIAGAVQAAQDQHALVMADLLAVPDPAVRVTELLRLGCRRICVHTGYDSQQRGHTPLQTLRAIRNALSDAPLAVAGGIQLTTIDELVGLQPEVIIVGGAITRAADPGMAAQKLYERIHQTNDDLRRLTPTGAA
jgi:3-hexulose-6-phosphate synthase